MWKSFALSILLAASAFATPFNVGEGSCGMSISQDKVEAVQRHFEANWVNDTTATRQSAFTVPVYWHVFLDKSSGAGNVLNSTLNAQTESLSRFFAPVGLRFQVAQISRYYIPSAVFNGVVEGNEYEAYLKKLHKGNAESLNIYTVGYNPAAGTPAWSSWPWDYASVPQNDGIVIYYRYLQSRQLLAHQVGHWAGLLHTFQGGCDGNGDYVADTPAEARPASGCPRGRNSCPGSPGLDPIDNIMDTSDDTCRIKFTPGQYQRIVPLLAQYRGIRL